MMPLPPLVEKFPEMVPPVIVRVLLALLAPPLRLVLVVLTAQQPDETSPWTEPPFKVMPPLLLLTVPLTVVPDSCRLPLVFLTLPYM
ncbi:hypothetical protein [Azonexus sp.]|uniref:hypothetical protein n=1 Tax=Azonexus sp. TaxID=1872668 RepID=UPI0027BB0782|nr:hypothetical protein [Azonexus sp.]